MALHEYTMYAGTCVDGGAVPGAGSATGWTNPGNAVGMSAFTGSSHATCPCDKDVTNYINSTNYDFDIDPDYLITGIKVELSTGVFASGPGIVRDYDIRLIKSNAVVGDNLADTGQAWNDVRGYMGDSGNLWGETWTVSDINDSGFGVAVSGDGTANGTDAEFYGARITVYADDLQPELTFGGVLGGGEAVVQFVSSPTVFPKGGCFVGLGEPVLGSTTLDGHYPTGTNDDSYGVDEWLNPNNIHTPDASYARFTSTSVDGSNLLTATNYGFNFTPSTRIDSLFVEPLYRANVSSNTQFITDKIVSLTYQGTTIGVNMAHVGYKWPSGSWMLGSWGGSNTWGAALTPEIVNDPSFGVVVSAVGNSHNSTEQGFVDMLYLYVQYVEWTGPLAVVSLVHTETTTGDGLRADGTATVSRLYYPRPEGGVICSGSVEERGVLVGGAALISYRPSLITMDGGVIVGGTALAPLPVRGPITSGADCLRIFLTAAVKDAVSTPSTSLGGYPSYLAECSRIGFLQASAVRGLQVVQCSRWNGEGPVSVMQGTADSVSYLNGDEVTLVDGEVKVLESADDPSKWVRVRRFSDNDLTGSAQLELNDQFNNAVGMGDVPVSGSTTYRGLIFYDASFNDIQDVKLWIDTLAPEAEASASGLLGGSGGGHIDGGTNAFQQWPRQGWCRIERAGSLVEIVHYVSRSNSSLNILSSGRGRLGTSAASTHAGDELYCVPGIGIGYESLTGLTIQTIPNETTAPTGITYETGITADTGLTLPDYQQGEARGVWIMREVPSGAAPCPEYRNQIQVEYTINGTTYHEILAGRYRVYDSSLERYEVYGSPDYIPDPEEDVPLYTFTSLPNTHAYTLSNGEWNVMTARRNKYDMVSAGTVTKITVSGGVVVSNAPSPPIVLSWTALASGAFQLKVRYNYLKDTKLDRGTHYAVYIRTDGTEPDIGTDTPVLIPVPITDGSGSRTYTTGVFSIPTTGKVVVRIRRASDGAYSTPTAVYTAVSSEAGIQTSILHAFLRNQNELLE